MFGIYSSGWELSLPTESGGTGYDLKGRTLFFQPQFRPFLMWLERGHLATETRPLRLDLRGAHLQGDVIPDLGVATAVPD